MNLDIRSLKILNFKVILGYKIADFCVVSKRKKLQIYAMKPDASIWKENIKIGTITYSPKTDIFWMHGILALSSSIVITTFNSFQKISNLFVMDMHGKQIDNYELEDSEAESKSPRYLNSIELHKITLILLSRAS